jgi:hypothetical protein
MANLESPAAALAGNRDGVTAEELRTFKIVVVMHVVARMWIWAMRPYAGAGASKYFVAVAVTGLALAAMWRGWERIATAGIALLLLGKIVATFPQTSNHALLELIGVSLLAFLDRRSAEERELMVRTYCWIVAIVLFHSGLQKVLYGTYFDAQFLGAFIAAKPSFAQTFGLILPATELSRLQGLPIQVGAGSFAVNSLPVLALSNLVYIVEMALPVLLLWPRTRTAAAVLAMVFTAALQTAARELFFGALFINFLLLFPRPAAHRRFLPAFAVFYASLLILRVFAPAVYFN